MESLLSLSTVTIRYQPHLRIPPAINGQAKRANQDLETTLPCMVSPRKLEVCTQYSAYISYKYITISIRFWISATPFSFVPSVQAQACRCHKIWHRAHLTLLRTSNSYKRQVIRYGYQPRTDSSSDVCLNVESLMLVYCLSFFFFFVCQHSISSVWSAFVNDPHLL